MKVHTGKPTVALSNEMLFVPLFREIVLSKVNDVFLNCPCAEPAKLDS